MLVVEAPSSPREQREALQGFLAEAQEASRREGHWKLASITLETDFLDPLAVLEAIDEPRHAHWYFERPQEELALAGAEPVLERTFTGADRFTAAKAFAEEVAAHTVRTGAQEAPFAGPVFLTAFAFEETLPEEAGFTPGLVFVPRWQVARSGSRYAAVAQTKIDAETDLERETERIWRAHERFSSFGFGAPEGVAGLSETLDAPGDDDERNRYVGSVEAALSDLEAGRYEKIVLARRAEVVLPEALTPLRIADRLRNRFPSCTSFSVSNGQGQAFIGATPELLVEARRGIFHTEALAGSAPRGHSATEEARQASALLHSEKDLREHRAVVDSIVRRLGRLGLDADVPARPSVHRLPNVLHLRSPIAGKLRAGTHLLDLAGALHPTAAVGGVPREQVPGRIRELEGFARGLYAGCLGWFDARGEGRLFVNLRSGLIEGHRATLFAGAGIVRGSDPTREWQETETKLAALRGALGALQ